MYVCVCRAITEADVRHAGHAGVTAPEDLVLLFGLNDEGCCGRCVRRAEKLATLAAEGAAHADLQATAVLPSTPSLVTGVARALLRTAVHSAPKPADIRRREV